MARKLINVNDISHGQWLDLRKQSIGGSEAAALMDMNPYSSPISLYADKLGLSKPKETNEAMRLGTDLEDYVAKRWSELTGKRVRKDNFMWMDDEFNFITANIDRDVIGENAGLECKTMGGFAKYDLESGEVPAQYYCQCQHYMMVKEYDRMYLCIMVLQRGVYDFTIERDDKFIAEMRQKEVDFWRQHIETKQMPAPDGSESSMETLRELYPHDTQPQCSLPNADVQIERYRELGNVIKDMKTEQDKIKAELCSRLGECGVGMDEKYSCSWKTQTKTVVDSKLLKEKYPEIYKECSKTSESRVFRTKVNK
jgi:putative phage-type endonuclease